MLTPEQYVRPLSQDEVRQVLAEASGRAALHSVEANITHPVDIATQMAFAVEYTAEALVILSDLGILKWSAAL